MPRGRGGKRDGAIGKNYSNRTDLQGQNVVSAQPSNQPGKKMAAQAASGQAYGAATAQLNAQEALPIANAPAAPAATSINTGQPQTPRAPLTPLNAPTDHGLPLDYGMPGTANAITPPLNTDVTVKALGLLNSLGDNVSPQVAMIRSYLQANAANGATR